MITWMKNESPAEMFQEIFEINYYLRAHIVFHWFFLSFRFNRVWNVDQISGKTFASGAEGTGFKSRADEMSQTLRLATTAPWNVGLVAQSREDGHHSLVTLEWVLSEYIEDLIFLTLLEYFCYCLHFFYKNNFIRTRGSFFAQNLRTIKNNPSLSRRTKSQILS